VLQAHADVVRATLAHLGGVVIGKIERDVIAVELYTDEITRESTATLATYSPTDVAPSSLGAKFAEHLVALSDLRAAAQVTFNGG
jgi:hypothetical protein